MEIKAPEPHDKYDGIKIFLGGSIEMDAAENWQDRVASVFQEDAEVIILNPRRDDWDSSWKQDPTEGTQFHEQVTWELDGQEVSDVNVYYFDDDTKSPITLLELGLFSLHGDTVVRVTPKFYRYGNIKIVCDRYNIACVETFDEMIKEIQKIIK